MTRYQYMGDRTLTFVAYVDVDSDKTLTAEPGGVYAIRPTTQDLPVPPDNINWSVAEPQQRRAKKASATSADANQAEEG